MLLYKGRYRQRAKYQSGCKVRNLLLWDRSTKYLEQRNLMLLLATLNSPFNMTCMKDRNMLDHLVQYNIFIYNIIKRKLEQKRNWGRSTFDYGDNTCLQEGRYLIVTSYESPRKTLQ